MRGVIWDAFAGLRYRYPPCCVLWYCLDRLLHGTMWRGGQARRRGVVDLGCRPCGASHRYVPCPLHQGHPSWRPLRADS